MCIYLTLYTDWQLGVRRHAFEDCRLKVVYQDHFDDKLFGLVPFCVENICLIKKMTSWTLRPHCCLVML